MPSEVILPRVDMDMATGKIAKWLVPAGAAVTKGQPLFEIETDKATMEIEAEATGTIRDLAEAGAQDIPVGSVVAWIFGDTESETAEAAPAPAPEPEPVVAEAQPGKRSTPEAEPKQRATPLARRLARREGIDLSRLRGSGPRGRIQASDIAGLTKTATRETPRAPAAADRPAAATQPSAPAPLPDLRDVHADTAVRAPVRSELAPAPVPAATAGPAGDAVKSLRDGTGTPLLLVHGFGSEAASWRPFLQGLDTARPVRALDLPGHGSAPLAGVDSFDALVEAVGTALADLGPLDVVAHSLGAAVMTAVAARGLADIRSLLLVAPAGLGPEINGAFIDGFLAATSEASLAPWMRELVADPSVITPAFVRATLHTHEDGGRIAAQRTLAAALFPDGTQSFSIRADLARLRIPVRVVFGSDDRIIPARHSLALPPLAALHRLPNVGHMPYLEAREILAAILAHALPR